MGRLALQNHSQTLEKMSSMGRLVTCQLTCQLTCQVQRVELVLAAQLVELVQQVELAQPFRLEAEFSVLEFLGPNR